MEFYRATRHGRTGAIKRRNFHADAYELMEDISELLKPPFDKPVGFMKLFDVKRQKAIMQTLTRIKNNAIHVVA